MANTEPTTEEQAPMHVHTMFHVLSEKPMIVNEIKAVVLVGKRRREWEDEALLAFLCSRRAIICSFSLRPLHLLQFRP